MSISSANRLYRGTEACVLDGAECQRVLGAKARGACQQHARRQACFILVWSHPRNEIHPASR